MIMALIILYFILGYALSVVLALILEYCNNDAGEDEKFIYFIVFSLWPIIATFVLIFGIVFGIFILWEKVIRPLGLWIYKYIKYVKYLNYLWPSTLAKVIMKKE